jgi:GNAT superfamily N-acetyltransferase
MNTKIRKAVEDDIAGIIALYAQPEMDNGNVLPEKEAKTLFNTLKSYPCYNIYIATLEDEIVGTFALLIMDNLAHMGAPSGIIEDVAVDPKYQGKGIGKFMISFAINLCKEAGCYKLSLSSNIKRIRTHKFYESLGFKQHGISFVIDIA